MAGIPMFWAVLVAIFSTGNGEHRPVQRRHNQVSAPVTPLLLPLDGRPYPYAIISRLGVEATE